MGEIKIAHGVEHLRGDYTLAVSANVARALLVPENGQLRKALSDPDQWTVAAGKNSLAESVVEKLREAFKAGKNGPSLAEELQRLAENTAVMGMALSPHIVQGTTRHVLELLRNMHSASLASADSPPRPKAASSRDIQKALDGNPFCGPIMEILAAEPGIDAGTLAQRTGKHRATVLRALSLLEKSGRIERQKDGRFPKGPWDWRRSSVNRYYPKGEAPILPTFVLSPERRAILELVESEGEIRRNDIARILGKKKRVTYYHVQKLGKFGLLKLESNLKPDGARVDRIKLTEMGRAAIRDP